MYKYAFECPVFDALLVILETDLLLLPQTGAFGKGVGLGLTCAQKCIVLPFQSASPPEPDHGPDNFPHSIPSPRRSAVTRDTGENVIQIPTPAGIPHRAQQT